MFYSLINEFDGALELDDVSRMWTDLRGVGLKLTVFHDSLEIDNEVPSYFWSG